MRRTEQALGHTKSKFCTYRGLGDRNRTTAMFVRHPRSKKFIDIGRAKYLYKYFLIGKLRGKSQLVH